MTDKAVVKAKHRGVYVLEGAGVKIRRVIGKRDLSYIDPFMLLDEFRSDDPGDYVKGFPWHPHRGIETVTYMIEGRFRHQDSEGNGGEIGPGCIQWMTAGRGIYHSEMPAQKEGPLWGYQLWLSLPAKDKMCEPRYQDLTRKDVPVVKDGGAEVAIISGRYGTGEGPAKTWFPIEYFDVRLASGGKFVHTPAPGTNTFIYVHTGEVGLPGEGTDEGVAGTGMLVMLDEGAVEASAAGGDAGFLYVSGRPNDEPVVRGGPFVMNTREQLMKAFEDWENGRIQG